MRSRIAFLLALLMPFAVVLAALPGGGATGTTPYRFSIRTSMPRPSFPADNPLTEEGVALGRMIFFERKLSIDNTISCAKCHDPFFAFAEPLPVTEGLKGKELRRNSMPLFNLAWRKNFFWDGRVTTLREQVLHPVIDPGEMGETIGNVLEELQASDVYTAGFRAAFGDAGITTDTLALALEQYLLVHISQDSKFDKAQRGEAKLTPEEAKGFQLFMTEFDPARGLRGGDCFHCHGNALFTNERFANNGLDAEFTVDRGRHEATGAAHEMGQFKVPTLRNVAMTAPYMHDGRLARLKDVVDHYNHGVKESETLDPNLMKHGGDMGLPEEDRAAIVAFLHTLTDEDFRERIRGEAGLARETAKKLQNQ